MFNQGMVKRLAGQATAVGTISVLIWGSALPITKAIEDRIGLAAFMGFAYAATLWTPITRRVAGSAMVLVAGAVMTRFGTLHKRPEAPVV